MTKESFEEQVTKGNRAQWIVAFEYKEDIYQITISLTHDTENFATERNLIFNNVEDLKSDWHDRDDTCIDTIYSANEAFKLTNYYYYFHTDQREVFIRTTDKVIIEYLSDENE